jgi:hypothetical protein
MPYQSKSEREAASRMTWGQLLKHVRDTDHCDDPEARRQIGNAIADGELLVRWADQRKYLGPPSPTQAPGDEPPRDAHYWQECETDPDDHVLEPHFYDPDLVHKRSTKKRLDAKRRFRKPIFKRDQVLRLWPQVRSSSKVSSEKKAIVFLAELLKTDLRMRKEDAWKRCHENFPTVSSRRFQSQVWPQARQEAGLEPLGRPGRKPKRKP